MADAAARTVRAYYEALREGDPLYPFFAPDADEVVKVGISERLVGYEAVEAGLREQTRTTADWTVESRDLRVTQRDRHAWFADEVRMAWRSTDDGTEYDFETRWSGTLERDVDAPADAPGDWRFVGMHVSAAGEL